MIFAGYAYIAQVLVIVEIVVLVLAYRRNPRLALYVMLVSIFLKGQYLIVDRPYYAWHFAAVVGLYFMFINWMKRASFRVDRSLTAFDSSVKLYFIYSLAISVPMWILFSAEAPDAANTGPTAMRISTQVVYLLFLVGLYGFGQRLGSSLTTFDLIRALAIIATVLAYFALLQVVVMTITGINLFPIYGDAGSLRSAYILNETFRATSFAGEPKHLGILMSVGLTAFYLARLFRIRIIGRFDFHMPIVMVSALLLSFSTTGFVLTVASIGVITFIFFFKLRTKDIVFLGSASLFFVIWISSNGSEFLSAIDSQTSKTDFEVQDVSVRLALLANPMFFLTGTGLGNIHLLAVDYLPHDFPLFLDQGYKANSGIFFVLGDSGLPGLLLLLVAPFLALRFYRINSRFISVDQRTETLVSLALLFLALVSFLLRYDVYIFFLSGFVFSRLSSFPRHLFRRGSRTIRPGLHTSRMRLPRKFF